MPKPGKEIPGRVQSGALNHVALNLTTGLDDAMAVLDSEGIGYSGPIDRGYERSIYFRDPNGYVIELTAKRPGHDRDMDPAINGARAKLDAWTSAKMQAETARA